MRSQHIGIPDFEEMEVDDATVDIEAAVPIVKMPSLPLHE